MKCYLCNENEANSVEHIIPNAIGGKIKAIILCRKCNSTLGSNCDAMLAKKLLCFSNLINHSRRGNVPNLPCKMISSDGKEVSLERNAISGEYSALIRNHDMSGDPTKFSFSAYGKDGERRLRNEFREAITGLGKKYGWSQEHQVAELQRMEAHIVTSKKKINSPEIGMQISFGGKDDYLSCLKTATNFFIQNGYDRQHIENAIGIIQSQSESIFKIAKLCYPEGFFPTSSIFHTIYLKGDSKHRKLVALISYYNVYQVFLLLNDDYNGMDFEEKYCYDIWNEKEVDFHKSFDVDIEIIHSIFRNGDEHYRELKEQMCQMISTFMKHFSINEDANISQNASRISADFILKMIHTLAQQDGILEETQFVEIILASRPQELNLLKDKEIKECIAKSDCFKSYLQRKTSLILLQKITKIAIEIIATEIYNNQINAKALDWDSIKQKIIATSRTLTLDDEKLNVFTSGALNDIFAHGGIDAMISSLSQ